MAKDDETVLDKRFQWLEQRVSASLKLKAIDQKKIFENEENKVNINEFLEVLDIKHLFIFSMGNIGYVARCEPPTEIRKKGIYFTKIKREKLVDESLLRKCLSFGDLVPDMLSALNNFTRDIFVPIIQRQRANAHKIPDVMVPQLKESTNDLLSHMLVTVGLAKKKTLLPLPPVQLPQKIDNFTSNSELLYTLDSSLISWTSQIRSAIKSSPEDMLEHAAAKREHPGPLREIEFWRNKSENLTHLEEQLESSPFKKILAILTKENSNYCPLFFALIQELKDAAHEARDNYRFLQPLASEFKLLDISSSQCVDFDSLVPQDVFRRLFYFVHLLWTHSMYYNTAPRIVTLIREMANDLITCAMDNIQPSEITEGADTKEIIQRLSNVLYVCEKFKSAYFNQKQHVAQISRPWNFENTILFARLDAFLERCHDLLDVMETTLMFEKLEFLKIGGTQGQRLTQDAETVKIAFDQASGHFLSVGYNLLDVDERQFDNDYAEFRSVVRQLEQRLGTFMTVSITDAKGLFSIFKAVDTFEGFSERPIIQQEWADKQMDVIKVYYEDLLKVQVILHNDVDLKTLYPHMPEVSCWMMWGRSILERIKESRSRIQALSHSVLESDLGKECERLYHSIVSTVMKELNEKYKSWAISIGDTCIDKLQASLLTETFDGHLKVNFHEDLVCAIREAYYLDVLKSLDSEYVAPYQIPNKVVKLFDDRETFRNQVMKLDSVCSIYNKLLVSLRDDEEKPLFKAELTKFSSIIQQGLNQLRWNSGSEIDEFVEKSVETISSINNVCEVMHQHLDDIRAMFVSFAEKDNFLPLLQKYGSKTLTSSDLQRRMIENHETRCLSMTEINSRAHELIDTTLSSLNNLKEHSNEPLLQVTSPEWRKYTGYVNVLVRDLLTHAIVLSLDRVRKQLDDTWLIGHEGVPLIEIKLTLSQVTVESNNTFFAHFDPYLSQDKDSGHLSVEQLIDRMVQNILRTSTCLKSFSLDVPTEETYYEDVSQSTAVRDMTERIHEIFSENVSACETYITTFDAFQHLWKNDMKKIFKSLLGKDVGSSYIEESLSAARSLKGQQEFFGVPLKDIDQAITECDKYVDQIELIEEFRVIGFIRVNARPLRTDLRELCRRWREQYTGFLINKIRSELESIKEFVERADKALDAEVLGGNVESLKSVMHWIRECRKKNKEIMGSEGLSEGIFSPINEALQLLHSHVIHLPNAEEEIAKLEELEELRKPIPELWNGIVRKSLNVRAQNSSAQDREEAVVKDQVFQFEQRLKQEVADFHNNPIFTYEINDASVYDILNSIRDHFQCLDEEAKSLRDLQELFELTPAEFKEIKECRGELMMLKQVWDLNAYVTTQFDDWMTSSFRHADMSFFEDECKKIMKQLQQQPLLVKGWLCFKGVEECIRNMRTSLPLCQSLSSPSMRQRHWDQLFVIMKQETPVDPYAEDFTLSQLFLLGVHKYVDDVLNVVERADKELRIEKNLFKIIETWEKMECSMVYDKDLDIYLLGTVDEISEQVESDSNSLSSMLSDRFVEFFHDKVFLWQKNLSMVESCLTRWIEIQRQWLNLFPIFIQSEDIRIQLGDDTARFAKADLCFRSLMSEAHPYSNVVELMCTRIIEEKLGRNESLEDTLITIQDMLILCEKSLAEYLETKRKIFPRFFFVSATDLIDILSKSSDPQAIMTHMSKIIDSVETFIFDQSENPSVSSKEVCEMISREGENVTLAENYACEGPVEIWLDGIINIMRKSVRMHISEANATYIEKPRNEWIYQYPCQAIIAASRIWFTTEVHQAFTQLEEGNDSGMKDLLRSQKNQLDSLIKEVLMERTGIERKMLVHLITIDVHNRDIVQNMVDDRVDAVDAFAWQSQLRYYWDEKKGTEIRIADAEFTHGYEYNGLCGCLVITKLTDRCYITLTQAVRLKKGGAPAGPAGTGKTETTKDLARNLGLACYVFNCSDQMNYITLGQIFKGLSMSGCWGCFDEFNRISIEVLSVVATQVGSILNALKEQKKKFRFQGEEISINPTVGLWITMNPGYAGRTELPENIKSLFRPCAMVVPDLKNICEIMLAAEGFIEAKDLALKFVTLYKLNKELLSPQDHYDWGLRAVKSVLYIAGSLRRGDLGLPERNILMRALRDTNMAKLSKDDVYVFMGLIRALFPNLDVPKKDRPSLVQACKQVCLEKGNLTGENDIFILKCMQYEELLHVRHSVFILGPAGSGKTECWRCLQEALTKIHGQEWNARAVSSVINPKAVSSNELYGFFTPNKEWRDGILSHIFREYALESKKKQNMKWIVLDGIIDAEWIESMNTVMDDNKILTLVSNERIPLTNSMRMIFEVSHLANASPATVSRAGVVFINETDVGWQPFKDKWIAKQDKLLRGHMDNLFDKYVGFIFDYWKRSLRPIVSLVDINIIQTICYLLEGIFHTLDLNELAKQSGNSEIFEKFFVFAVIWAFGGPLPGSDGRIDMRQNFSNFWRREFPSMKMSDTGTVFDYYVARIPVENEGVITISYEWKPWTELVQPYIHDPEVELSSVTVQTADTVRMSYLMNLLMNHGRGFILVGTAGTGKSNMIMTKLMSLNKDEILYRVVSFNARTSSIGLQSVMEQSLEKRSGKIFGPPNRKKLVFFMDDMNMPSPDKYGTQEAIALLQQHVAYGFWYDRHKIIPKEVVDLQYVGAMNPKSGTFTILDRLLRQFAVFSMNMPDKEDLVKIYGQILTMHLSSYSRDIRENLVMLLTNATIELHSSIVRSFFPTAIKFHYQWNMREMFNIFQGLCQSNPKVHRTPSQFTRLWVHECIRTFRDRMPVEEDMVRFDSLLNEVVMRCGLPDVDMNEIKNESIMWAPFLTTQDGEENVYNEFTPDDLNKFLAKKLNDYNDIYVRMDLVLFKEAMEHICRIARITANPRGNALLVGVGGSGKQSLARLASYINNHDIFQIVVTTNYTISDFRTETQELYRKCGLKSYPFAFIITDSQVVNADILVYLNDMLSNGFVPDMFNQDERDAIIGSIMNDVKMAGIQDYSNPDICWSFFINRVRSNLHVILCFSPVGKKFSSWCRQFPALANTTVIDWFHPWPSAALKSVALRFLENLPFESPEQCVKIADFMAFSQEVVTEICEEYYAQEKRRCFTTPKLFLELISFYKLLLAKKRAELNDKIERLHNGIKKIQEAGAQVTELQEKLAEESLAVDAAREKTMSLLENVSREKAIVEEQGSMAEAEEAKTNKIVEEVENFASQCASDLAKARPLVEEALGALDTLDKASLSELKNLGRPPAEVQLVGICVRVLTADPKNIPSVRNRSWDDCKRMMNQVDRFMADLKAFDVNNIPQANIDQIQMYINNPSFNPEVIRGKSVAAAGLCKWAIGIHKYHLVRCEVRPKEQRLAEAQERLSQSRSALKKIQDRVMDLKSRLDELMRQYDEANAQSQAIEAKAKKTREKADLAERLVLGLSDENIRWGNTINELRSIERLLIGDTLLAAAFVSYIGPFSKSFRGLILTEKWIPFIRELQLPMTQDLDVIMQVLTNEATVASWNNEGLPSDAVSTENGAILVNSSRWPLMIDPQLQGVRWIRRREEKNGLRVIQVTFKNWVQTLQTCIEDGFPCLLEGLGEFIEPILDPVLGRAVFSRGGQEFIRFGGNDVLYNPKFRFFLQTRLSNPQYGPEINAQATLINFMVTETGLEDQLLAAVVSNERPDLEKKLVTLMRQMNSMTIELQECENGLLYELSNATGDVLDNAALIENLENTKRKAKEINASFALALRTQKDIGMNRLQYKSVATRGSLLFFQLDQLCKIDHVYQYSLEAFMEVFYRAVTRAKYPDDPNDISARVKNVTRSIMETVFAYTSRGLFERHKLIFSSLLGFSILTAQGEINRKQLDFLLRGKKKLGVPRPESIVEWCSEPNWASIQALAEVEGANPSFELLPNDMVEQNRWRLWTELERPEEEKLPADWRNLTSFQKLLVLRCLRPDRLTAALETFAADNLGKFFVSDQAVELSVSFQDASPTNPIFFILSPGVDPLRSVEELGRKLNITYDNNLLFNISLGQGQEIVADTTLQRCFESGGWVVLNNIHLVEKWLKTLEARLERYAEIYTRMGHYMKRRNEELSSFVGSMSQSKASDPGCLSLQEDDENLEPEDIQLTSEEKYEQLLEGFEGPRGHPNFRIFLSAEPSELIPIGILQCSIKLCSEPPSGIKSNIVRALTNFNDEPWERSSKPTEYRCIMFAMSFFHSVVVERKKFGPQGWNRVYPFNTGDLTTCMEVTVNYIDERARVPWEDLRYVFGEIMYGGHITDDWDRVLCMAYLRSFIVPECLDGMYLAPNLPIPNPMSYNEYMTWLAEDDALPPESPILYGLHPNAEINFRTVQADVLFKTINEIQPKQRNSGDVLSPTDIVQTKLGEIKDRLPEQHNLQDLSERLEEDRTPQQHVFYQECERMNILIRIVRMTLEELELGIKGELSMSMQMLTLFEELFLDKLPEVWKKVSFISMRPLGSWVENFSARNEQLSSWVIDLMTPKVTNLSYFFKPMSLLTAIIQTTSIQNSFDLDRMSLVVDVLKKSIDQIDSNAREGCYLSGFYMEGARWDSTAGCIEESRIKELYSKMPIMQIRALPNNKVDRRDQYECPVYSTQQRGPGFVVGLFLKTREPATKWVIAGVGLLLDVVE